MSISARLLSTCILLSGSLAGISLAENVTLSDIGLKQLDYDHRHYFTLDPTAAVTRMTDLPGPGIELEISILSVEYPDDFIYRTSSKWGGAGALAGLDLSSYDYFELAFTLVSIDGSTDPSMTERLVVGSYVDGQDGPGAFRPEVLTLQDRTAVSSTTLQNINRPVESIEEIGWTAYPLNGTFDPGPHTIVLQIAPVLGAVVIPEPTSLLLLLLSSAVVLRRCSR